MSFPHRQIRLSATASLAACLAGLVASLFLLRAGVPPPVQVRPEEATSVAPVSRQNTRLWDNGAELLVFAPSRTLATGEVADGAPEWASRFALLGTVLGVETTGPRRPLAVLRDGQQQIIVRQGEFVEPHIRVERIAAKHVLLRDSRHNKVRLDMASSAGAEPPSQWEKGAKSKDDPGDEVLQGSLGRLDEFNRRVFTRDELINYYTELRNEPERMLAVFDSMKPVYDHEGGISGYRLQVEGEEDFFKSVGLVEDDIVRSVNSVPMTSRVHAEHFIARVVADGLDTIAMEVERGGEQKKLIYLVDE